MEIRDQAHDELKAQVENYYREGRIEAQYDNPKD